MESELYAAFFATIFFSILLGCPRRFLFLSGLNGFIAWLVYLVTFKYTSSLVFANFAATSAVMIFSQAVSLIKKLPLDVFLVPGIIVLVPGSTIYKMFYSFMLGRNRESYSALKETLSIGFSVAMAIFIFVFVFEVLNKKMLRSIKPKSDDMPDNSEIVFATAVEAGAIMLESGAETHKVEETIETFSRYNGLPRINCFVIPTGIIATFFEEKFYPLTELIRISKRNINLGRIAGVMETLNNYYAGKKNMKELIEKLQTVKELVIYKSYENTVSAAFAVAFFAVLFKGGAREFWLSAVAGLLTQVLITCLSRFEFPGQLINLTGSAFIGVLAIYLTLHFPGAKLDVIITSSVMLFVPGVTIINSLREIIAGDLVSGSSRAFEALITAASIAAGVGAALTLI